MSNLPVLGDGCRLTHKLKNLTYKVKSPSATRKIYVTSRESLLGFFPFMGELAWEFSLYELKSFHPMC